MRFFIEGPFDTDRSDLDRAGLARVARAQGHHVTELVPEQALEPGAPRLPDFESVGFEWGVLVGDTPSPERYAAIVQEAAAKKVQLLNDPAQHLAALEFHRTVAQLDGLTARTEVVTAVDQVDAALARLPPPVFVRGSLGSRKWYGWDACVAPDAAHAKERVEKLLALRELSRGHVLLRELLPLRRLDRVVEGFPQSRECRLFVLDAEVITFGAYWPLGDPFGALNARELSELHALAREAAIRTKVPWLCVDVGQLESGEWRVIETADPACCALGGVSPTNLVAALASGLEARAGC